jgi:N-acetylated-alpha-linked acidic dipeptidase
MGSTEWVEDHAAELQSKTVVYINSDSNDRGFFGAGGSHTLETMINEVSRDVMDPQYGVSIQERLRSRRAASAATTKAKKEMLDRKSLPIGALGSGSDYSPFFQHLGIPSLNLGFGGESGSGDYHSIYDSYDLYVRFKDSKFEYGVALAKAAGRVTLRMANAEVLSFDYQPFYKTVNTYLTEVTTLLENLRESTEVENRMLTEQRYVQANDPKEKFIAPQPKEDVPFLNFSSLQNAIATLEKSVTAFSEKRTTTPKKENVEKINQILYHSEQALLSTEGLPRRPLYRHTIYAPGFYTGYGVKTLPGIREAIEQRSWKEAQEQIEIVAKAIVNSSQQVDRVTELLTK